MSKHNCLDCNEPLTRISLVEQQGDGRTSVELAFTADQEPRTSAMERASSVWVRR